MSCYALDLFADPKAFEQGISSMVSNIRSLFFEPIACDCDRVRCADLVEGLLAIRPNKRWSLQRVLSYPWVLGFVAEAQYAKLHIRSSGSRFRAGKDMVLREKFRPRSADFSRPYQSLFRVRRPGFTTVHNSEVTLTAKIKSSSTIPLRLPPLIDRDSPQIQQARKILDRGDNLLRNVGIFTGHV